MTEKKIHIHVGDNFDAVAKRVAENWHRAANGNDMQERHISFVSWDLLASVMTNRRYELLRHLHQHPEKSIASLAREMRRDYKRVHEDVNILESAGLVSREEGMLCANYDFIESSIRL